VKLLNIAKKRDAGADVGRLVAAADEARDAGDWAAAAEKYAAALAVDGSLAGIWVQKGHALKEQGDLTGAEESYRVALRLTPGDADGHLQLGHALKLQGRAGEAADAYLASLELAPNSREAMRELLGLGYQKSELLELTSANSDVEGDAASRIQIAFDVSDLIGYFSNVRTPTGIQRVQINVITSLLAEHHADLDIRIICYSETSDYWREIPSQLFVKLCALSKTGASTVDLAWRRMMKDVRDEIELADDFAFAWGARIVNIGTSWWLRKHFLNLRHAKARHGIVYIPFLHDFIPLITPEHCVKELTQDFVSWCLGVFQHADHYIANSNATANDLARVAGALGHGNPAPSVVHLDGEPETKPAIVRKVSDRVGTVMERPYVLFVSTIESRKNHLFAFNAWLRMIRQRGEENVPDLVCVGNRGLMVDAALGRLASSARLSKKVTLLSGISDVDLAALYRNCEFTIYPSSYEGWGLPVTESLSFAKVPVVTAISSLPEAGGEFADYFELGWEADFIAKVTRLLDDKEYRRQREKHIRANFRPRKWSVIAGDILAAVRALPAPAKPAESKRQLTVWPLAAKPGELHRLCRSERVTLANGASSGEMFRAGRGWNFPDDWGCWMRNPSADIAFSFPDTGKGEGRTLLMYIGLKGLPDGSGTLTYDIRQLAGAEPLVCGMLAAGEQKVCRLRIPLLPGEDHVHLVLSSDLVVDLGETTDGVDRRKVTLGVEWFYFCLESDLEARQDFIEAQTLNDMSILEKTAPASVF
jgi:glycosyltransferase involved in cell wall biosynthesis